MVLVLVPLILAAMWKVVHRLSATSDRPGGDGDGAGAGADPLSPIKATHDLEKTDGNPSPFLTLSSAAVCAPARNTARAST